MMTMSFMVFMMDGVWDYDLCSIAWGAGCWRDSPCLDRLYAERVWLHI
jgi:hypothetical protein